MCLALAALALMPLAPGPAAAARPRFVRVFDGRTLNGWTLVGGVGPGYVVRHGDLVCPADGGGNLFTTREYSDFDMRFDFRLSPAGNNGIGVRAPLQGDAAYMGMELQILDNRAPEYAHLEPGQYCCSIYKVAPAKRRALRPVGQWNHEEIRAGGRRIRIRLNGHEVVNADLNAIHDPAILAAHPGMLRDRGHVGFLGHGPSAVEFRNVWIADLSRPEKDNTPPAGFTALFNGRNLNGWKGLVADPPTRAKMSPARLATAQQEANRQMRAHWKAVDGVLENDGNGANLCTTRDYRNFEMLVDWKITPGGDSGIYLRGSPQVQIWDVPEGSGGLYNNQKNPSHPLRRADNPAGRWNRFRILMMGDRVTVYLNNQLVVWNVPLENYWQRDRPIYPVGQIELQQHTGPLWFKNLYIREIPPR